MCGQPTRTTSAHQAAPVRFDDAYDVLLWPLPIRQEILDAVPSGLGVVFAFLSFIKEFAVVRAHVLVVSFAVFDPHKLLLGRILCEPLRFRDRPSRGGQSQKPNLGTVGAQPVETGFSSEKPAVASAPRRGRIEIEPLEH